MTAQLDRAMAALRQEFKTEINAGAITHLGISNCRRKNNGKTSPWSEHSWPNAVDIHVTRGGQKATGAAKALGDRIAKWMRSRPDLWSEVFWQVLFHYDHIHGTAAPRMNHDNRQVPPCAGGSPTPSPGGDNMLNFNIGRLGAEPVRGEQAAALQLLLNDRGAKLAVDGVAGDATRNALIAFQTAKQIGPPERGSGEIGAWTYSALFKPVPASGGGGVSMAQVTAEAKKQARAEIGKAKVTVSGKVAAG